MSDSAFSPDSFSRGVADFTSLQGFPHFMLKEIHEQPQVVQTCLSHYLNWESDLDASSLPFKLGLPAHWYEETAEIHILACGTSRHAGLVSQFWLEQLAEIPTRLRSGSEFLAAPLPIAAIAPTLTVGITQSGETTDTLMALELEQQRRLERSPNSSSRLLGITNQPSSSLAKVVDYLMPTLAGPEIGVAATKTFVSQLVVLYLLALEFAVRRQKLDSSGLDFHLTQLQRLPELLQEVLQLEDSIQSLAQHLVETQHCVILGRGIHRAIALEGALKLKETTYLHAEGYAAGEFMHGPMALLDAAMPVIAIAPAGKTHPAILENISKARSHGATAIGIVTADIAAETKSVFDLQIVLPVSRWVQLSVKRISTSLNAQCLARKRVERS